MDVFAAAGSLSGFRRLAHYQCPRTHPERRDHQGGRKRQLHRVGPAQHRHLRRRGATGRDQYCPYNAYYQPNPTRPIINDPNRRIYRGVDPSLQARDRVEVVNFSKPGTYLVICGVLPHFQEGMYGYVRVLP
jgi:hypothetical protein